MITSVVLSILMSTPAFQTGDLITIVKGEGSAFIGCRAKVVEVLQPPEGNFYDLAIQKCQGIWLRGKILLEYIPESYITPYKPQGDESSK